MSKYLNSYPKVILLGDSLTERCFGDGVFGSLLQSFLKRKADVITRAYAGYNSKILKIITPQILNKDNLKDVACLTLWIGANDSFQNVDQRFDPGLSTEEYKQNVIEIIDYLVKNGLPKDKIILITPPSHVIEEWEKFSIENGYSIVTKTPERTKKYVDIVHEIGKELNITVIDTFEPTNKEDNLRRSFIDGLHFSDYGGQLVFELIKDEVNKRVEKFRNSSIENFPSCDDIDFKNLNMHFDI